jgi:hypothetical protein
MKITKITTNSYNFYKEGSDYILNLGAITQGEDTSTELLFEEVENVGGTTISPKCGCTTTDRKAISSSSFSITLKYNNCDASFTKVVAINEAKSSAFKIKIIGTCNQK